MRITRHYLDVGGRRVHYRRAGSGPALLMLHQSPRSSAEYAGLMARWGAEFTCIAPDTPGFGQSEPLPSEAPDIDAFADALAAFLDAAGLGRVAAYGFHSGGIILMAALRLHPGRFTAIGVGGYAVWTADELALFGDAYLPPFRPTSYGEHLTWLWNRVLEQSWYFPWFAADDAHRLPGGHDDPTRVDAVVREMLDAGDAYRAGYGAVLRAPRGLPGADAVLPPVLIAAYDGDPLQPHIDRLGALPAGWRAAKAATPDAMEAAMLAHLRAHPAPVPTTLREDVGMGFVAVRTDAFDGLIHWQARSAARDRLLAHAPGEAIELVDEDAVLVDLPGHGLSDGWPRPAPETWGPWDAVLRATAAVLGCTAVDRVRRPCADPARSFPDLSPDRFGAYLTTAWSIVRADAVFDPWYLADAAHARPLDAGALEPGRLALRHRARLRAVSARAYAIACKETP